MQSVEKIRNNKVSIEAPPSKAHTLRSLIIGSLARGQTTIEGPLLGQDQLNVISCLKILGISIEQQTDRIIIEGGGGRYSPVSDELNVGESGVGMNFLSSAACLCDKPIVLTGAPRILERPIAEVVGGLQQLGANIEYLDKEGFPPIRIAGGGIEGGRTRMRGQKSSQYFSSICISSPYARQPVTIECVDEMTEKPYLDISLQMMSDFGVEANNKDFKQIDIPGGQYSGRTIKIEGDYSSASFFFLAGAFAWIGRSISKQERSFKGMLGVIIFGFAVSLVIYNAAQLILQPDLTLVNFLASIGIGFLMIFVALILEWKK